MEEKKKTLMESQLPSTEWQSQQRKGVKRERLMESELPDEIIDEILSRLPVKSLLRFKCVCKRWLSTISDPTFHHKTESESILIMEGLETLTACLYSIDDNKRVIESFSVPCNKKKIYKRIVLSNSCNGLVIIGVGESLFLFNPMTRCLVKVLALKCLIPSCNIVAGLCYDASTNDYKVVIRFTHRFGRGKVVVVASLKTKRCVQINFPFHVASTKAGPVVNGRMHWSVQDRVNNQYSPSKKILYFDPCRNLFAEFPSPQSKFGDKNAIISLGVLGGYLCIGRVHCLDIEVVIMKKYGVRESWTSLTILSLVLSPYPPILFTKNGEILQKKNESQVLAYNLEKKTKRTFDLPIGNNFLLNAVSLVQNLTSPSGYEWDEIRHHNHGLEIEWLKN